MNTLPKRVSKAVSAEHINQWIQDSVGSGTISVSGDFRLVRWGSQARGSGGIRAESQGLL